MNRIIITEHNRTIRMLGREAMRPYVWLTIAGVCFFSVILDIPSLIWGGSAWSAEEIQQIANDYYRFGILPQIPRYYYINNLYAFLITGPLTFGLASFLMKIFRRKQTGTLEIFLGFANFGKTFLFYVSETILIALGSILFVIPGLVLAYSYAMGYYLMNDNPELRAWDAMKLSRSLMKGNRWKLFTLHLSFIGWGMLIALATWFVSSVSTWLGAFANVFLSSLLTAYIHLSEIAFYEMLVGHLHRVSPEVSDSNVQ